MIWRVCPNQNDVMVLLCCSMSLPLSKDNPMLLHLSFPTGSLEHSSLCQLAGDLLSFYFHQLRRLIDWDNSCNTTRKLRVYLTVPSHDRKNVLKSRIPALADLALATPCDL